MRKIFITILLISINLISQTTSVFNLQGILRSPTGQAVADGKYSFTFKIYDQAKAGLELGGWVETQNDVEVKNGIYNVLVGSKTPFTGLAFDKTYFIGISVGGGDELSPRIQLTAAPYALSLQGSGNKVPNDGPMTFSSEVYHRSNDKNRLKFNNDGSNEINGSTTITGNGQTLQLVGTDHSLIEFFPNGKAAGRKGYLGYPGATVYDFTLRAVRENSNLRLEANGSGKIITNSNLDVGGSLNVTKAEGSNVMVKVADATSENFNTQFIRITGLDGLKHRRYKVFFSVYRDGGSDKWMWMQFNDDGASNHYVYESIYDFHGAGAEAVYAGNGGTNVGSGNAFFLIRNGWSQQGWFNIELTINISANHRMIHGSANFANDSNPVAGYSLSGFWKNTANLTSITFGSELHWREGSVRVYAIP